jgi:Ca2+-binding EF-hand superfamily protein
MQRIQRLAAIAILLFAAAGPAPNATAAETPEKLHAHADRNKDGAVDRHEFSARQVDIFYFEDADKDGALSATELPRLSAAERATADTNRDGKIQLSEFLELRSDQFETADVDDDGALSFAEFKAAH